MSNHITIELCQEDRERLDKIIAGLGNLKPNCHSCTESALKVMGENLKIVTGQEPDEEPPAPLNEDVITPEPVAEPEQPKYTTADILAKVQTMASPGNPKRERAKAIVTSYGKKVSDIPEDKRNEAMQRLIELEGEV